MRYNIYENGGAVDGLVTISGMTAAGYVRLKNDPVELMEASSKQYTDGLAGSRPGNSVKEGIFFKERLPHLSSGNVILVGSNNVLSLAPSGAAPNIYPKLTVGTDGLVTGGQALSGSDIPSIGFSKITTGKPTTLDGYGISDGVGRSNGAVVGNLTLPGNPATLADVCSKQYADSKPLNAKSFAVGDVISGGYDEAPTGFLRCNGGEVSKTTYAALYSVIGDAFGGELMPGSGRPWQQQYDFNNEQSSDVTGWVADVSLPVTLYFSQAVVTKNRVYLLGGYSGVAAIATTYTAPINSDGTLGEWTTGTSLPAILQASQPIVTKNRVYLLGGAVDIAAVSTVYTAPINSDGTIGAWTTGTNLPAAFSVSQAIVTKNRVYLLGGYNGDVGLSTVYTAPINADGTLGAWTIGTSLPVTLYFSQAVVTKNRVYLLGGHDGVAYVSTVYTALINSDGTLGAWTTGTSLPMAYGYAQALVSRNSVYLFGGAQNNGASSLSVVYRAPINTDGTLGVWVAGTSLPSPVSRSVLVATSSRIYLLGGWASSQLNTVYSAPFLGGLNDYSSFSDGTISTVVDPANFRLPDYASSAEPNGKVFVKY